MRGSKLAVYTVRSYRASPLMPMDHAKLANIGPYALELVLGRGGMGVVYRGVHRETGALAAVKTVRMSEVDRLSQIRREVQSLARLDHPGVVRVLEHGVDRGIPWYAMELLEGLTLADLLSECFRAGQHSEPSGTAATLESRLAQRTADTLLERMTPVPPAPRVPAPDELVAAGAGRLEELLGLAYRLCETLAYVHGEGVLHRDIKPSNVFVTAQGRPVLVDFGLAARVGDAGGRDVIDSEVLTGGSARYMAPEQIRGEPLDPRCDLYSLGCLLFELITGRTPFVGGMQEVIDQQLRRPAPRLSRIARGVPPELERLVSRLLTKDRRERLGYARDVATALASCNPRATAWDRPVPRDRTYLYRPPLVGRQRIMRELEWLTRKLHVDKQGGLVLVHGESGIGKTRLAMALAQHASKLDAQVIASGCSPLASDAGISEEGGRSAPLEPLRPFLRALADRCIEGGPEESALLLGGSGQLLAAFEPAFADLASASAPGSLPAPAARERLFRALREVLARYAARAPLLLIMDDLQWADELTLGLLLHLTGDVLQGLPVLVVGLLRAEELSPPITQLMAAESVRTFPLGRLGHDDVVRMVSGMLSLDDAPPEFARFLSDKSEGNAFFVAEYLRIAVAEQLLVRNQAGQWTLAESTEPTAVLCESLPLPQSLREVVERRLAPLGAAARQLLLSAATVGRAFDLAILQAACPLREDAVLEALSDLVQRHIVEPVVEGAGFRFTHDKLRELPYAGMAEAERRAQHRRVAAALAAHGDRADHAALGHHWLEAGEPGLAFPPLKAAGEAALRVHAIDRAIVQLQAAEWALGAVPDASSASLLDVREQLGDACFLGGKLDDAREAFERALEQQPARLDVQRARLFRKVGKTWEIGHRHESALEAYDAAEQVLRVLESANRLAFGQPSATTSEWFRMQLSRMWVFYWQARISAMNTLAAELTARIHAAEPVERSEYYQALVRRDLREHRYVVSDETLHSARRSLADAEAAHAEIAATFARFTLAVALVCRSELQEAEVVLLTARAEARKLGDATTEIRCLAYLVQVHRRSGRVEETQRYAEETLSRARAANMGDYVGLAEACLGWVALKLGRNEDALRSLQSALDTWSCLSFVHPFQWHGILPWLALQLERAPLRNLVAITAKLLDPALARLPAAIEAPLQDAVRAYTAGDRAPVQAGLSRGLRAARELGYL